MQEFIKQLVFSESGKLIPSRLTEKFFQRHGLSDFVNQSTSFYNVLPFNKRVMLVLDGKTEKLTCHQCGRDIDINQQPANRKTFFKRFCDSVCSGKSRLGSKIIRSSDDQSRINEKRKQTMLDTYGTETNSQREDVKLILRNKVKARSQFDYSILQNKELLLNLYQEHSSTSIADMIGCDYSVVLSYLRSYGVDIQNQHQKISNEQRILANIVSIHYPVEMNSKVGSIEVDILFGNNAIEYNGFPWHLENFTSGNRGKNYHSNKTEIARLNGIKLLHVFPHQMNDKFEIVKSIIFAKIGHVERLFARKCIIKEIKTDDAKDFLNTNHINGYVGSTIKIGLFFDNLLVHVMTFSKSRYRSQDTFEIIRSASKLNTRVIGAVSKCVKYFLTNFMNVGDSLMTYADLSISDGESYAKSGMLLVDKTPPNYFYVHRSTNYTPESRLKYQKHKLTHMIGYCDTKTEWEIMQENGFDRYWDCGSNVYRIEK
jgi:hypothetical protein